MMFTRGSYATRRSSALIVSEPQLREFATSKTFSGPPPASSRGGQTERAASTNSRIHAREDELAHHERLVRQRPLCGYFGIGSTINAFSAKVASPGLPLIW